MQSLHGEVLWHIQGERTLDEAVRVSPNAFSEARVIKLCRSFLAAHRHFAVVRYVIATDAQDTMQSLQGPGVTDVSFQGWRNMYVDQHGQFPAAAELIRITNRASVRIRFLDRKIVERVLENSSPLKITFRGEMACILHVASVSAEVPPGVSPITMQFYVQTAHPWTIGLANAFTRAMRARTGIPWLQISLEDGWWFAGETRYPIYNPFLPYREPPTFEQFKKHTRFFCLGSRYPCLQRGPALEYR